MLGPKPSLELKAKNVQQEATELTEADQQRGIPTPEAQTWREETILRVRISVRVRARSRHSGDRDNRVGVLRKPLWAWKIGLTESAQRTPHVVPHNFQFRAVILFKPPIYAI